jgi:hypothetical protein
MGTRMMFIAQKDNEIKIAQHYGYDGSPTSEGLNLFKNIKLINIDIFKEKLDNCSFFSDQESKIIRSEMSKSISELTIDIPESIMQSASSIIEYIDEIDSEEKINLLNYIQFLDNCNYIYFLNFDTNSFEVHHNNFSDKCNKCLKVGNIRHLAFERIAQFLLSDLPTLQEYKSQF